MTATRTLSEQAKVIALSEGEELADAVATDIEQKEDVLVVLDRTPFYAEMGGQVADHGYLVANDAKLRVNQVKKTPKGYFVHTCTLLEGNIKVGDEVTASVDEARRMSICRNHTATHLLQAALREVLGDHVHQAGSYQDDKITHFDFTHFSAVTPEELHEVERRVNEKIFASLPVEGPQHAHRRGQEAGRHGTVRRKVRRDRPCCGCLRLEHRVLRRHPCEEHGADRLLPHPQ